VELTPKINRFIPITVAQNPASFMKIGLETIRAILCAYSY